MYDRPHTVEEIKKKSDGDFYSLMKYLDESNKLRAVISSDTKNCSGLLKRTAKSKMQFMYDLRRKLEYKKKGTI
ncbi:MAG: hypothetical protein WCP15_01980 [bacterium]